MDNQLIENRFPDHFLPFPSRPDESQMNKYFFQDFSQGLCFLGHSTFQRISKLWYFSIYLSVLLSISTSRYGHIHTHTYKVRYICIQTYFVCVSEYIHIILLLCDSSFSLGVQHVQIFSTNTLSWFYRNQCCLWQLSSSQCIILEDYVMS